MLQFISESAVLLILIISFSFFRLLYFFQYEIISVILAEAGLYLKAHQYFLIFYFLMISLSILYILFIIGLWELRQYYIHRPLNLYYIIKYYPMRAILAFIGDIESRKILLEDLEEWNQ